MTRVKQGDSWLDPCAYVVRKNSLFAFAVKGHFALRGDASPCRKEHFEPRKEILKSFDPQDS